MLPQTLPIFLSGVGSVLEVCPVPHVYQVRSIFAGLTDSQRLASDWYRVGYALYSAIGVVASENAIGQEQETAGTR
jgi:hypothetical protein